MGLLHRCSRELWSGEVVADLMQWSGTSFSTNSTLIDDAGLQMGIILLLKL
jgi:hypothetical protein